MQVQASLAGLSAAQQQWEVEREQIDAHQRLQPMADAHPEAGPQVITRDRPVRALVENPRRSCSSSVPTVVVASRACCSVPLARCCSHTVPDDGGPPRERLGSRAARLSTSWFPRDVLFVGLGRLISCTYLQRSDYVVFSGCASARFGHTRYVNSA